MTDPAHYKVVCTGGGETVIPLHKNPNALNLRLVFRERATGSVQIDVKFLGSDVFQEVENNEIDLATNRVWLLTGVPVEAVKITDLAAEGDFYCVPTQY